MRGETLFAATAYASNVVHGAHEGGHCCGVARSRPGGAARPPLRRAEDPFALRRILGHNARNRDEVPGSREHVWFRDATDESGWSTTTAISRTTAGSFWSAIAT